MTNFNLIKRRSRAFKVEVWTFKNNVFGLREYKTLRLKGLVLARSDLGLCCFGPCWIKPFTTQMLV